MAFAPFDQPLASEFAVPVGWVLERTGRCRSCGVSVAWCSHNGTGRKAPLEADGKPHQERCPHRDFHAQRAKERAAARRAGR